MLFNTQEELFHEIESHALISLCKLMGVSHFNILLPAASLDEDNESSELVEIEDYCDRGYVGQLSDSMVELEQADAKTLILPEGPVYPSRLERKIYSNHFGFDYFALANPTLLHHIDRDLLLSRRIFLKPAAYFEPAYSFNSLKLKNLAA